MIFYIGLNEPADAKRLKVPYMLSVRRLFRRKSMRKKLIWGEDWLLDSGGFSELMLNGKYTMEEDEYIKIIQYHRPSFAFCQDWMCEPYILEKTGLSIDDHQELTLLSYVSMANKTQMVAPVLQGYEVQDYIKHAEMYESVGTYMGHLFGIGSVCRRSTTNTPEIIIKALKRRWPSMNLHAFGLKTTAFKNIEVVKNLYSADSMAWSYAGRREDKICDDCDRNTKNCANCYKYARFWLNNVLDTINKTKREKEK